MNMRLLFQRCAALAAVFLAIAAMSALPVSPARAAEGGDACDGTIAALLFTITQSGVWCVQQDLVGPPADRHAIDVGADHVVVDCRHHTIAAPPSDVFDLNVGVSVSSRHHVTVRNCNLVGFAESIRAYDGNGIGGYVVEDNRVAGSRLRGIALGGGSVRSVVRRNRVVDTGSGFNDAMYGILVDHDVDVLDNTVDGVANSSGLALGMFGIKQNAGAGDVSGNRIRGVLSSGGKPAYGIYLTGVTRNVLRGNDVTGTGTANTIGIHCSGAGNLLRDTVVTGFPTPAQNCGDAGGNELIP
jgi:hypothetical protein